MLHFIFGRVYNYCLGSITNCSDQYTESVLFPSPTSNKVKDYGNDPFFVKKAKAAEEFLILIDQVLGYFSLKHIHLHAHPAVYVQGGGAYQFVRSVFVFDKIHRLI